MEIIGHQVQMEGRLSVLQVVGLKYEVIMFINVLFKIIGLLVVYRLRPFYEKLWHLVVNNTHNSMQ